MKTILLPVLSLIAALAFVKPADAVIGAHTCTTTYTTKSGDTCATLSAKAGWSVSKFEAINPTVSCSPLKTGVKVCTVIQYIKTTTTTTKTTTAKTTTTTKKTTTTTKPTTTTAKTTTTTKKTTTTTKPTTTTAKSTTTTKKTTTTTKPTTTTAKSTTTTKKTTTTTKPTTTTTKSTTTTKPTTTTTKTTTTAKSTSTGSTSGCTKTYTVASGDSCWQIATNNALQEPVFESYNPGIDCTALQVGQVVCVTTGSVASTTATTTTTKKTATTTSATSVPSGSTFVCSKTYTVISGDSCYAIATNLGMAEPDFESYNPGINCDLLQVGQVVCTGGSYTTATKTTATKTSTSATATATSTYGCTKTHVIGSTEYCYDIAQNANISLDQLMSYNTNLNCNNLKAGTSLCVAVGPNGGAFPIIPIYTCSVANTFAITFDDGPYKYTQELVDYLNNNSITATFFINGQNYGNIYDYKDFLISAYNSGHQIAHHTWSHANISTLTDDELRLEITELEDAFLDILGVIPTYFRPPFGEYLDSSLKVLNSLGYKVIVWDIDTDDWQLDNFAKEQTNFLNGIADNAGVPGHISLEHDPHQVTVEQLVPWAFPYVKSKGYKATTVSECIGDNPSNWYRTKSLR